MADPFVLGPLLDAHDPNLILAEGQPPPAPPETGLDAARAVVGVALAEGDPAADDVDAGREDGAPYEQSGP